MKIAKDRTTIFQQKINVQKLQILLQIIRSSN